MATQNLTRKAGMHKKREERVFTAILDYSDTSELDITTSADVYELFKLPANSYVTVAELLMLTASDSATSAAADVGFAGGDTLIDGANLKSAANTKLSGGTNAVVPQLKTTASTVTFKPTFTGATTVGKWLLRISYVEIDMTNGELTEFSST